MSRMASGVDHGGLVFVVDDDEAMREATGSLLRSIGLRVQAFATAAAFLESAPSADASCLVLDVRMPGGGEPAIVPMGAAIADAVFDATGGDSSGCP